MMNLMSLILENNLIQQIENAAFINLSMLVKLNLKFNKLIALYANPLFNAKNSNLKLLYFSKNKINKVKNTFFNGVYNLNSLDLAENMINEIEINSFVSLSTTQSLKFCMIHI